ncbi:MAG: 4-(cytidine 5'-diphospho)-2-C-methyl-D-erythritol kinase [Bacteroidales bacterium]|jgi:4-diphosphocytidyl-2-C-methyl-D-erythritol kinase|nr:4-(cytidine 5'-diphospho)-2-C-methyl-D-erythritol kinase [Bacteroidales bacterium]
MTVFPAAKINIGLRITEKRADGFHNIETLFYPLPFCDALEFVESCNCHDPDSLVVTGIESVGKPEDNLVIKAVRKLRERKSFPGLRLHLHKVIPPGAGLGGGSSDAAFILKGINRLYGLGFNDDELKSTAIELGSDCPFFIDMLPAHASGRGEILTPLPRALLDRHYLVLAKPAKGISTGEAYASCRPATPSTPLDTIVCSTPIARWKDSVKNDFDAFAFAREPLIRTLIDEMYRAGALFSLMSGSGSAVYGIFQCKPKLSALLKEHLIWQGLA